MTTTTDALVKLRERAEKLAAKTPKTQQTKTCACGCNGQTKGGDWIPGHNSQALSKLLNAIREEAKQKQTEPQADPEPTPEPATETPAPKGWDSVETAPGPELVAKSKRTKTRKAAAQAS